MQVHKHGVCIMILAFTLSALLAYYFLKGKTNNHSTLKLVHLIFRHGDRNPDAVSLYPSSPYYDEKYYPEGYGQLTNAGKMNMYNLGKVLREKYDGFLEKTWNTKNLEAWSTYYDRTKMSLELVLAGLYPSTGSETWSPPYFQAIPYSYVPKYQDKEFLAYHACPRYEIMMNDFQKRPDISKYLQRYNETYAIVTKHTGLKMDVNQGFLLFVGFVCQEGLGYPFENWTKAVYPEPLQSITVDMYHLMTNNTAIKRMVTGYFFKKLLADTKAKIDGTLKPPGRKMFIYSGHEMNIATILLTLKALKLTEVPPYGAHIIFEVHKIDGVYGIKVFYQNHKQKDPIALRIPGCNHFCPYEDFYKSFEEILPTTDEDCYGPS